MNYWKHSLLSKKKFNGAAEDYLAIHKFMDSSKLFYFDIKHRLLLHNTYGIQLCMQKFGDTLVNADGQTVMVRDVAAEHCKEDLLNTVPTLNHWFKYIEGDLLSLIKPATPADSKLKEFVLLPLLMSGLRESLIITHSNFGVYLVKEFLGIDYAVQWASQLGEASISPMLQHIKLRDRWQYRPDIKQLQTINHDGNIE